MTPYEQARKFYAFDDPSKDWPSPLLLYASTHFAYSSPTAIVLAKPEGDYWWIEFMAGDMKEALGHLPYWLPQIRFQRRGKDRIYWTATLVTKLLQTPSVHVKGVHDSVQNGSPDPVFWWGWWWNQDTQTATAAVTIYCRRECGEEPDSRKTA